ncbi:MAG TPA: FAD-dependent oxidoreductase, partial [Pyrinomonadaceae bacterium]|nr:FAD-dependent oxidoreductase [Pyrinomonadaceae bacterium]
MNRSQNFTDKWDNRDFDFELGIEGFLYSDLFDPLKLRELTKRFYDAVEEAEPVLGQALRKYIEAKGAGYEKRAESNILTDAAPHLSQFIAKIFRIEEERQQLKNSILEQNPVWKYKFFTQRRAIKKYPNKQQALGEFTQAQLEDAFKQLRTKGFAETFRFDNELGTAEMVIEIIELEEALKKSATLTDENQQTLEKLRSAYEAAKNTSLGEFIEKAALGIEAGPDEVFVSAIVSLVERWSALAFHEKKYHWAAFRVPHPLDYMNLVRIIRPNPELENLIRGPEEEMRRRDGFKLTDSRGTLRDALYEIDYCMICHERLKDSCSTGLREPDGKPKRNPLGIKTEGCPLDERISEMHLMKKNGDPIAALSLVTIDNPMCAGTGHRICNDCMKGCIFQKQEPVNIPLAETSVLTDVLKLPFGFEIYSLLARWNPLNAERPFPLPYNGKKVLVVGLGPAGYTLAHYLLNEGFGVVGVDGLKIEKLPEEWTGNFGSRCPKPIRDISEITEELDQRILSGFGGVSEYGITVRWDKNFLTMIQLMLSRRQFFRAYGGVRFGGTLTIEDAWSYGFDHIAIATGAGRPTIVPMKNNLIRGIRQASDFLMALQLTGAFKKDTLSNLQIRLPAVVIGGGLTGIDTATELAAYYPVQVEKMLEKYEAVAEAFGEEKIFAELDDEEKGLLNEFIAHGRAIRQERERASQNAEEPDFQKLVQQWGGVSLIYRKRLQDSPAYRLNHEEVQKALEEGINFVECMNPSEAVPDEFGAVKAVRFEKVRYNSENGSFENTGEIVEFPARTVCIAAGTSPNVIYEKEKPGTFKLDQWNQFFLPHKLIFDEQGIPKLAEAVGDDEAFFTSYNTEGKFISYYGDNHPKYAGNVVKAMASAKKGYKKIT